MRFNKDHKVRAKTLKGDMEVQAYLDFLEREKVRHIRECNRAFQLVEYLHASAYFYLSAIDRHVEDTEDIDKLIEKVRSTFDLQV